MTHVCIAVIDSESVRVPAWHVLLRTRVGPFGAHMLQALMTCLSSLCSTGAAAAAVAQELAPILLGREPLAVGIKDTRTYIRLHIAHASV